MVERYKLWGWANCSDSMCKDEHGDWVPYEDYKELLKLYVKALLAIKERDEIVALVGDISELGSK